MPAKTILIADDDPASRELMAEVFRQNGHVVIETVNGDQASQALERLTPDLLVVDIQMPMLGGYGILRRLRQHHAAGAPPIVAVTAHAMAGDRERALAAGFDDYITKPVDLGHLRRRIETLLTRHP